MQSLPLNQQLQIITQRASNRLINPKDRYLEVYPELLASVQALLPLNRQKLVFVAHAVFGWMPTQLRVNMGQVFRDRFARHYSDFASLWRHPGGQRAAERFDLLERVRLHKSRYFASSWAHYKLAVPGTMRLLLPESRMTELRRDYAAMRPMFLGEPLSFEEMLAVLGEAEQTLNRP